LKFPSCARVEDAKRTPALELIVGFVRRCYGDLQIVGKLSLAPLASAFGDIVAYGIDCSEKLRAEARRGSTDRSVEGRAMARDRELVGLVPDFDLAEGMHAENVGARLARRGTIPPHTVTFPRGSCLPSAVCCLLSAVFSYLPSAVSVCVR
jgi:hypothetical protein